MPTVTISQRQKELLVSGLCVWLWLSLHKKLGLVLSVRRENMSSFDLLSHHRYKLNHMPLAISYDINSTYTDLEADLIQLNLITQMSPMDSGEISYYRSHD